MAVEVEALRCTATVLSFLLFVVERLNVIE
ncbi:MAG: hypothetical protein ACJAXY_000028 [Nonlabens sp.]|jgi:hypothetical protein